MILSMITQGADEAAAAAENASKMMENSFNLLKTLSGEEIIGKLAQSIVEFAFDLLVAALVFCVGRFVIRRIYAMLSAIMVRRAVERSLSSFILSFVNIVLYFILIVAVIGILGINTSSFIALFASAGVAVGMALSGTLQNFAGGVLILLLKPYKVGDYIEAQGYAGTVTEIQIFSTIINTPDNKSIIIPNGGLSTSSINNYSREMYRCVSWTVSMAYGDDFKTAREAILKMLKSDERIVKSTFAADIDQRADKAMGQIVAGENNATDELVGTSKRGLLKRMFGRRNKHRAFESVTPERVSPADLAKLNADRTPSVVLSSLAASSVDLTVKAWVRTSDYWGVYFDFNERFYCELPQYGINFPFPQLDVHLNTTES